MDSLNALFSSINPLWWIAALVFVIGCFLEIKLELIARQNRQLYDMLMHIKAVKDGVMDDARVGKESK